MTGRLGTQIDAIGASRPTSFEAALAAPDGTITRDGSGWALAVTPVWLRDTGVATGDDVLVELGPERPQRSDLAPDISSALEASPAAAASFDTLTQVYRKAYLRWIDATSRRPDVRAARIAEVVDLLAAGIKERPRS